MGTVTYSYKEFSSAVHVAYFHIIGVSVDC